MNQSSSTPKAATPNEVACTIILAQQLLLKQENIPATPVSANAATFPSSGIALETEQEQTIAADMNTETTEEATETTKETISLLQIHPPPRPTSKSSSDPNSRQIYALVSRNGRARHHLALAKEFFADLDNDEYDDDSDSDYHDTTASPTCTCISSGSQQTKIKTFNELVCAQPLRNTSSSPDQRQEAKTLSLQI